MILAQTATHSNSLYHEWGLMSALIGVVAVVLPILWWLHCMKTDRMIQAVIRVRSVLAGMFKQTVVQESRKIFRLVQTHLPYSLSQVDSIDPQPSAFDKLCQELGALATANEPDRDHYRKGLERAFSGVIIDEVEKLLAIAESQSAGAVKGCDKKGGDNPTGMLASFEGETERKLTFIAQKTGQANKTERTFYRTKAWTFRLFAAAAILAFLAMPGLFCDLKWAFRASAGLLLVCLGTLVTGIMAWVRFHSCQQWFEETAERYRAPEDWMGELARTRTR